MDSFREVTVECVSKYQRQSSCLADKPLTRLRKRNGISVFWQKTELHFFQKWRRPDAHLSKNDESSCADTTVAVLVLAAEV